MVLTFTRYRAELAISTGHYSALLAIVLLSWSKDVLAPTMLHTHNGALA